MPSHIIPAMAILNIVLLLFLQAEPLPVQIHRMLRVGDAYNAGLVMESFGEPRTISTRYLEVSNYLYWTAKDLPAVVTFAQQGIDLGVANARQVQNTNSQLATALQLSAATLAYNLASFTWPGWNEPGIEITSAHLTKGFQSAQLAVQLMTEANGEPPAMFGVNWVLGAHQLARGQYADAIAAFEKSHQIASAADLRGSALLARGYVGLAKVAGRSDTAQGEQELKAAKDALIAEGIQGGPSFVTQLDNAHMVFVKP